jgi:hypothetical protein
MPFPGYRYPKGIFALQHRETKKIYLGYTRNFEKERLRLKAAFDGGFGYSLPAEIQDMRPTQYADWQYVRMEHAHPDADARKLRDMLRVALDKVGERAPELLLNRTRPHGKDRPRAYVVEVKGKRYSLRQLALAYGLEPVTIQQRYHRGVRGDALVSTRGLHRPPKDTAKT